MKLTSERVNSLYDLMDAAYAAQPIYAVTCSLGHVPIIDNNSRGKKLSRLFPMRRPDNEERTVAERFNSRLKEEFGGGNVVVGGVEKESRLHLLLGVIALFPHQLLKLIS